MIEINNLTDAVISEKLWKVIGEKILKAEGAGVDTGVSVAIVGKDEIMELNRIYRGKNKPTDVLSFTNNNYPEKLLGLPKGLGEIVICPAEIRSGGESSLIHIFIHGLLHLLGYNHKNQEEARAMQLKEQKYLNFLKKQ